MWSFPTDHNWSDTASEKDGNSAPPTPGFFLPVNHPKTLPGIKSLPIDASLGPHEYHEISDEDVAESPGFDLGPSLMDEVLRALGGGGGSGGHTSLSPHFDNKLEEEHSTFAGQQPESKRGTLKDTLRKKQAHVSIPVTDRLEHFFLYCSRFLLIG